jgi:hypothetical protein
LFADALLFLFAFSRSASQRQGAGQGGQGEAQAGQGEGEKEGEAIEVGRWALASTWLSVSLCRTKLKVKTTGEIHVTLVGDKATSKTTILKSFAQDATKDLSGVFEAVSYPITITGVKEKYILRLFDTDPDELFSRIRAITYKTTDIFVICFDLTNEDTFKNCRSWYAEVNQLSSKSPVLVRARVVVSLF